MTLSSLLRIVHFIGLALAVGAATVKVVLLFICKSNPSIVTSYLKVVKPITKIIVFGIILLTISGISWLITGYPFSTELIIKIILVAVIWGLGPIIDNVIEPKFIKFAPKNSEPISNEFGQIMKKYLTLEVIATTIFYVIIIYWV